MIVKEYGKECTLTGITASDIAFSIAIEELNREKEDLEISKKRNYITMNNLNPVPIKVGYEIVYVCDPSALCLAMTGTGEKVCLRDRSCPIRSHNKANKFRSEGPFFMQFVQSTRGLKGYTTSCLKLLREPEDKLVQSMLTEKNENWKSRFEQEAICISQQNHQHELGQYPTLPHPNPYGYYHPPPHMHGYMFGYPYIHHSYSVPTNGSPTPGYYYSSNTTPSNLCHPRDHCPPLGYDDPPQPHAIDQD